MNLIAMRAGAFVVGSLIAGCVYTSHGSSSSASGASIAPVAVYPGARETSGNPDGDSADVTLHLAVVAIHFQAARYDAADAPSRVIAFYRKELGKLGTVDEKQGGPHSSISGFRWVNGPGQTTLHAGRTIVAVEPHGAGTEFALIQVDPATPQTK
jgi:hypothetical protein